MIFVGKAIADVTSNETHWEQSVFSKNPKDSFLGSKEHTYVRKDHDNKVIDWLLHNPLVFLTDIWHTANTIRRVGIYFAITLGIIIGKFVVLALFQIGIIILVFIIFNMLGFHIVYHYILRNKKEA